VHISAESRASCESFEVLTRFLINVDPTETDELGGTTKDGNPSVKKTQRTGTQPAERKERREYRAMGLFI